MFKVGDIIKAILSSGKTPSSYHKDSLYKVTAVHDHGRIDTISIVGGHHNSWHCTFFEKYTRELDFNSKWF